MKKMQFSRLISGVAACALLCGVLPAPARAAEPVADPHIAVQFVNATAGNSVGGGMVTVSNAPELKTLGFTISAPGGSVATGFADAAGAEYLNAYSHENLQWVDLVNGKGYSADGPIDGGVGGSALTKTPVEGGWISAAPTDGDEWFSYDAARFELVMAAYYPEKDALVISMMAKYTDSGAASVDASAPTEVFRFHYGLKKGQNGLALKDVFEAGNDGDFRLGDVRDSADGNSLMTGATMYTYADDPSLMSLELIPTIDTLDAVWGAKSAAAVVHQANSDFTDKTGDNTEGFTVDETRYNLYTLKGQPVKVSATSGFTEDAFAWRLAAVNEGGGLPDSEDAAWAVPGAADLSGEGAQTALSVTVPEDKLVYAELTDRIGTKYYFRVQAVQPGIAVQYYSTSKAANVSNASVVISGAQMRGAVFSVQENESGTEAKGFSDDHGNDILSYTGFASVDVIKNIGYDESGENSTPDAGKKLTASAPDEFGWVKLQDDAGNTWFSYDAAHITPSIRYYPATKVLKVTAIAKDMADGKPLYDCSDETEVFRFWFGLQDQKTGWNLKTVFETEEDGDDFRLFDPAADMLAEGGEGTITMNADNAILDARFGMMERKDAADAFKLALIPRTTGVITVDAETMNSQNRGKNKIRWNLNLLDENGNSIKEAALGSELDDDSTLTLLLEDKGTYSLKIFGDGYLPKVLLVGAVDPERNEFVEDKDVKVLVGNANDASDGEWKIDSSDVTAVKNMFYRKLTEEAVKTQVSKADFDCSGEVNLFDIADMIDNIGETGKGDPTGKPKKLLDAYDMTVTVPAG